MRASDRCKAVMNGDRCKKFRGHDSSLLIGEPDPIHEGANLRWTSERDVRPTHIPVGLSKAEAKKADQFLNAIQARIDKGDATGKLGQYMLGELNNFERDIKRRIPQKQSALVIAD